MAARVYGYPKRLPQGLALTDFNGKILGFGQRVNCAKVRPGARGSWISDERCSYRFKVGGQWYACRGTGEGMSASCRAMKPASVKRAHLSGGRRR
jgi:hypothetical protein